MVLQKLKWDEESDPEDMDEDDNSAFEDLRKVLRVISEPGRLTKDVDRIFEHSWMQLL